jgi:S-layer protein
VVIAGNAGLNMTNTETTIASVDASGITGTEAQPNAFTWTSGVLTNTAKTVSVVGTAAGVNTINLDAITDTLMVSTISVGGSANVSANVFTGGAGVDNVTGGSGTDSFTMKEGKDVITTGAGADKITFSTAAADRDTVTDFTAGTSGDKIILASYDASTDYAVVTTRASAYTVALVDSTATNVIEFALEGNSTVNLGDNSANSLTGASLLKALNDGETAATLTLSGTSVADADLGYVVAYQNGNAYVYLASVASAGTTVTADELTLVGILQDVALGAITSANFSAS